MVGAPPLLKNIPPDPSLLKFLEMPLHPNGIHGLIYSNFLVTAGEDYIGISTVLTFAPTMDPTSVIPVNVSVLDDDVTEGDERFEALLDILTTGTPISFFPIDSDRAPATILEDDSELY